MFFRLDMELIMKPQFSSSSSPSSFAMGEFFLGVGCILSLYGVHDWYGHGYEGPGFVALK